MLLAEILYLHITEEFGITHTPVLNYNRHSTLDQPKYFWSCIKRVLKDIHTLHVA